MTRSEFLLRTDFTFRWHSMLFSRPFAAFTSAIRIQFIFSFILLFKFGKNPREV